MEIKTTDDIINDIRINEYPLTKWVSVEDIIIFIRDHSLGIDEEVLLAFKKALIKDEED